MDRYAHSNRPNHTGRRRPSRNAITLPEVLVLAGIIGILLCLLLPFLVRRRETTRSNLCSARVIRMIQSVQEFESLSGAFPAGCLNPTGPIANDENGEMHHSWIVQLLPFLDQEPLLSQVDPKVSVYDARHLSVRQTLIPSLACPASPPPERQATVRPSCFAASYHNSEEPLDGDNNGVFFLNSQLTKNDIVDGEQFTLFLGEVRIHESETNLGWMSGTRATLRNTEQPPGATNMIEADADKHFMGGFGSWHAGFAHMAMGDGNVSAISNSIDVTVYRQLGSRNDGSAIPAATTQSQSQQ